MKFCGRDFLLLKGNEDGPPETFTQVGGMRTTGMTLNKEAVDITTKDDGEWRQMLESCGIKSFSISLAGAFTDNVKLNEIVANALARLHKNYQIVSGRGDSFEGPFEVASLERTGETGADEQYSITLESAGDIVFTAAP